MAESEGLKNPEDWIRQVIEQHIKEAVREENIFVEAFGATGENAHRGYYVTVRNSSLKIVDSVRLQMLVGFRDREGKEQMLELGSTEARTPLAFLNAGWDSMICGNRHSLKTEVRRPRFCILSGIYYHVNSG